MDNLKVSVDGLQNASKPVIAFRASCAKNFPLSSSTFKSENKGIKTTFVCSTRPEYC